MQDEERYKQGMVVRREVLGDAHVDRTVQNLTPLNEEFQNFITRYAWGDIWSRPGLDRHTRSMITIAMLIALNREAELKMHLNAAFNNGVTREELKELISIQHFTAGCPPQMRRCIWRNRFLTSATPPESEPAPTAERVVGDAVFRRPEPGFCHRSWRDRARHPPV